MPLIYVIRAINKKDKPVIEYLSDSIQIPKDDFHYFLSCKNSMVDNRGTSAVGFTGDTVACSSSLGARFNDNYIEAAFSFEAGSQYSVGSWFRPDAGVYVMSSCLPSIEVDGTPVQRLNVRPFPQTTRASFHLFNDTTLYLTDAIAENKWAHIVLSTDGNVYINGELVWTGEDIVVPASSVISLGNSTYYSNEPFFGYIANAFVSKRILTAAEIQMLYDVGHTPI